MFSWTSPRVDTTVNCVSPGFWDQQLKKEGVLTVIILLEVVPVIDSFMAQLTFPKFPSVVLEVLGDMVIHQQEGGLTSKLEDGGCQVQHLALVGETGTRNLYILVG